VIAPCSLAGDGAPLPGGREVQIPPLQQRRRKSIERSLRDRNPLQEAMSIGFTSL
jgi:hypothetical protein